MRSKYSKMTLLDIYYDVKQDMEDHYQWQDNTRNAYEANYEKLGDHLNDKPFLEYDLQDFENALTEIKEEGFYTNQKTVKHSYSEDKIKTFRSNLRSLDKYLVFIGACKGSIFWGTEEKINGESTEEDINILEKVKLQKSLSPLAEKSIFKAVMNNPEQDGEYFGIALMFGIGLRNAEACGAKFSDIVRLKGDDEFCVMRVSKTVGKKTKIKLGGKTGNVFRYVPIPDTLMKLIDKRKGFIRNSTNCSEHISESKDFDIDDLTIACKGNDFDQKCRTSDLSRIGKYLLKEAKVEENTLKFIDNSIYKDNDLEEKEATAYLFRRNFATMLQILGLTQNEIEYIMGHKIESKIETRNYYSNPDKLYLIKRKMDNRPLFSSKYTCDNVKEVFAEADPYFENPYKQRIIIPEGFGPGEIIIGVQAAAPGTEIEIGIKSCGENPLIQYKAFSSMSKRENYDRTTSILKTVHHVYASKKGGEKRKHE